MAKARGGVRNVSNTPEARHGVGLDEAVAALAAEAGLPDLDGLVIIVRIFA